MIILQVSLCLMHIVILHIHPHLLLGNMCTSWLNLSNLKNWHRFRCWNVFGNGGTHGCSGSWLPFSVLLFLCVCVCVILFCLCILSKIGQANYHYTRQDLIDIGYRNKIQVLRIFNYDVPDKLARPLGSLDSCRVWEAAQVEEREEAEAGSQVQSPAKATEPSTRATFTKPVPHQHQVPHPQNGWPGMTTCGKSRCSKLLCSRYHGDLVKPEHTRR